MTRRIELPFKLKTPILACGADLKGTFAVAKGAEAILAGGFGDLSDPGNLAGYEKSIKAMFKNMRIRPECVACDLHPGYFSSQFAERFQLSAFSCQLYRIQHHEAHVASAIVEHSLKSKIIGVAFDGAGYGSDGNIWGGEFFAGCLNSLQRVAHFEYVAMPGGDLAAREPWRMAESYLYKTGRLPKNKIIKKMIDGRINSPLTSSVGRLFDAVGSLVLSRRKAGYEAELPIALEKLADRSCRERYGFESSGEKGHVEIRVYKIIKGVVGDLHRRVNRSIISAKFHNTIADIISDVSVKLRNSLKIDKVVLSGGVFQNRFLTDTAVSLLKNKGFDVYGHSKIPTNDSGVPIGQIAIAATRHKALAGAERLRCA